MESLNPAKTYTTEKDSLNFYVKNYKNLCKFCCKLTIDEASNMKLIYDESTKLSLKKSLELIERITYILNNDSLIDDTEYDYINLICENCERKVNEFYEFKKSCEKNSAVLYQVRDELNKLNNKTVEKVELIDVDQNKEDPLQDNEDPQLPEESNQKSKKQKELIVIDGTVCQICGKLVKGIQMHMLIHKGIKKYKCQYCQKSFTQSGQLKRHINSHLNIRNYSCPHPNCDRTFVDPSSVTKHLVIHNKDDKKFVCIVCGTRFNRLGALRYHEKTHRQERNHKCTICDKSFLAKHDLTKHFRVHSGEKPYSCKICNKKFSISKNAKVSS